MIIGVGFSAQIRVRYNECDQQGIVFNANYLIYVDETLERWLAELVGDGVLDMMVKKATIEWHASARHGDVLELTPEISRWGNTSFDVTTTGDPADRGRQGRPVPPLRTASPPDRHAQVRARPRTSPAHEHGASSDALLGDFRW